MKLFSGTANLPLAEAVAALLEKKVAPVELHLFPDGEQRVKLMESVVNQETVVIQSTGMPTDVNYMQLFLLIDALRRSGAKSITVVIPYVGYQRQDHVFREGEARSLEVMIRFMEQAGGTSFIALDLHSIKIPELFLKPIAHLSALPLFAEEIKKRGFVDGQTSLVSPDMGGMHRLGKLVELIGELPQVAIEKNRDLTTGSIDASAVHGELRKRAIMLDDMISSGRTTVQACEILKAQGVEEIYVFATHPVFSEEASEILQKSPAKEVIVSDTILIPKKKQFEKLKILSVAQLIATQLKS